MTTPAANATQRQDPEQWLDFLLTQSRDDRIRMASVAVSKSEDLQRGQDCWMSEHDNRIHDYKTRLAAIGEALTEITDSLDELSEAARPAVQGVVHRIGRAARLS